MPPRSLLQIRAGGIIVESKKADDRRGAYGGARKTIPLNLTMRGS